MIFLCDFFVGTVKCGQFCIREEEFNELRYRIENAAEWSESTQLSMIEFKENPNAK
jgi:hypothetical protein